jgi:hypothetical protein
MSKSGKFCQIWQEAEVPFTGRGGKGIKGLSSQAGSWRNLNVSMLVELIVLIATLLGLITGSFAIYWVRVKPSALRARLGRRLFVVTLLCLGGVALFAAFARADGLAPLGLLSGLLTVGMLWESPIAALPDDAN